MEKWQFAAEIESAMSAMDYSQISELATAIMDSWGPELLPPQPAEAKVKQEPVPMEEIDPLDSFSFWDGENFYCHQDADSMQTDPLSGGPMPPLLEYEEMTREEGEAFKDSSFLQNAPTLAQLNSPPGGEFDFFLAADDSSCSLHPFSPPNSSYSSGGLLGYVPSSGFIDIKPPHSQQHSSLSSSCPPPTSLLLPPAHFLPPVCPQNSPASDSAFFSLHQQQAPPPLAPPPRQQPPQAGLLSSSAPPDVTMATYFPKLRAELPGGSSSPGPRSVTERSLSGFSSLSLSNDDESGSFVDDEDEDDDYSSDEDLLQYESDDLLSWQLGTSPPDGAGKGRKHRFFWQYNLQSRGSRAQQILPRRREGDPHVLDDAFDPVFSEECALPVKHSGKARRGDGNDLTPDPRKLFGIGIELRKLNRLIYNVNPAEGGKPLSRKEKNKLASRVCRLKKKAQHEANKIKLYGLQQEHKKLLSILSETRELLKYKIENLHDQKLSNCSKKLEAFLAANEPYKVAGNTTSFVNEVLEKVAKGDSDGGLGRL